MTKTCNTIKRDDAARRLFCLAVALWANYHADRLSIPRRTNKEILAELGLKQGGLIAKISELAKGDELPTRSDVLDAMFEHKRESALRKQVRLQKDKDETPEDVVAQFNAIVRKHPWLVTDLQLKRREKNLINC